jgi:NADH dehydrogenase FAD-containing subunit
MKRIVIIGAGYAGVSAAKELERLNPQLTIVLIHRLYYFFHTVGTPRIGSKDSQWASHLVIPLDHLFSQPQNRIITANVTAIYSDRLELDRSVDGDTTMTFDYAILCMGSAYNVPIKIQEHEPEKAISLLHAFHDKIQAAEKVLIVGAGLAGLVFDDRLDSSEIGICRRN